MRYGDGIPTNYLTGDALWQYIMKCVEQDEQLKMEMREAIKEGTNLFNYIVRTGRNYSSQYQKGRCFTIHLF